MLEVDYGIVSDIIGVYMAIQCNKYLVICMQNLPRKMVEPERKLTFAKVSSYVLDQRENRMNAYDSSSRESIRDRV